MKDKIVKCEKGWECLYKPIIDEIYKHDSQQEYVEDKIGIENICEKYGMFSIDLIQPRNLTDEISQMITNAGRDSLRICEFCGSKENIGVTMNFRYKTCCRSCWQQKILEYEPKSVWMPVKK